MSYLNTILNGEKLKNSNLNTSKNNLHYSFSKDKRFKEVKNNILDKFYDISDFKSKRTTCFGIGKKLKSQNNIITPDPTTYNITKDFIFKNKKITIKSKNNISSLEFYKKNIGPGSYSIQNINKKLGIKLKSRIKKKENNYNSAIYDLPKLISKEGKYPLSKNKNCNSYRMKPLIKKNNNNKSMVNYKFYDTKLEMNKEGKYYNSKYRNLNSVSFKSKISPRTILNKDLINFPGPGSYIQKSDFGIYKSSKFNNN